MNPFRHEALPYAGRDEFAPSCVSLLEQGLANDERPLLLAESGKLDDVRDALGAQADDVTFVSTDEHGRNPSRITTMLHSFHAAGDGRHALGVKETALVGRSPAAQAEARLADLALNEPELRSWPLSIVCLYDTRVLAEPDLDAMYASHSVIRGETPPNSRFRPELAATMHASALDDPPPSAQHLRVRSGRLMELRALVRARADQWRVAPDRADDLVLAVNEVVTNSLRHGGGTADVAVWADRGVMICEVRDRGHIADVLTGRFAPPPSATSGRGLWLVNQLCDLVQLRSSADGTVVRMHVDC
ncbi:MAG TPA: anti-sigma factor RsbA family regulatory protein [Jatrophihabitans sp.]|nr:anti-sigma factor RsbA family regulatory protein [Jatrophihabitans sp.]